MARIEWEDVTYRLKGGKLVLDGVSGSAFAGRLLGVIGPSGAGKTSLLAALGKRLAKQPQAILSGAVNYYPGPSGSPATANDIPMAYVAQETAFFSNLTVWETVLLSARLRCDASDDSVAEQAHALIKRLGLAECMHTRVGGDTGGRMVPGISGGEKRRLSIACELAGSNMDQATILIADEPTSGLDAFQADLVVAKLKELASLTGSIVMCSLHQPRSASMHRVDDLLLMVPGGRVAYHGPMSSCLEHFRRLGHVCPAHHSPAEFLVDLVSVDNSSEDTRQASEQRILRIVSSWRDRSDGVKSEEPQAPTGTNIPGNASNNSKPRDLRRPVRRFWHEFRLLFGRVLCQTRRDMWNHAARAAASLILGGAYGATNFRLGCSQNSMKKRASLMFQLCITTSMMSIVKTLNSFPRERVTVCREMARGQGRGGYGAGAYLLSKMLVETPVDALFPALFGATLYPLAGLNSRRICQFLGVVSMQSMAASGIGMTIGALCPSVDTALALGPALMVVSIMVADESGMFSDIPSFMKPLAKLSVMKWGFQGTMAAEMTGLTFEADDSALPKALREAKGPVADAQRRAAREMCLTAGDAVLGELGFGRNAVLSALAATGAIFVSNAALSFVSLQLRGADNRRARLAGNMA